ncbi:uncharacterized protein LOC141527362 [Cotesia typhae]|uniref:uncharacterized protein LOC141527362 n=1 Tax=Cotesia typhae TaxID=2053667 RepID=UPI003D695558
MSDSKRPGTSRTAIYLRNKRKLKRLFSTFGTKVRIPKNFFDKLPVSNNTFIYNHVNINRANVNTSNNLLRYDTSDIDDEETTDTSTDADSSEDYEDEDNYHHNETVFSDGGEQNNTFTDEVEVDNDNNDNNDDNNDTDNNDNNDDNDIDNESDEAEFLSINSSIKYQYPLIPKKHLKMKDHFLSIIATSIKHRMSYEAVLDIFRWNKSSHILSSLPTTKAALWRALCRNNSMISRYYYCKMCTTYLGRKNDRDMLQTECFCKKCGPTKSEEHLGFFLYISLKSQLKQLLKIPNMERSLKYRFSRQKKNIHAIEDIYDGEAYKKLSSKGQILEQWYNFSFTINTDGCQISNSSRSSAWPVYVELNELPPHMRKKYVMLAAIFVDDKHPKMNNLLRPFTSELRKLYTKGVAWRPSETAKVTSKFIVVTCTLDAPARAAVVRIKNFNGYFGCTFCYAKALPLFSITKGVVVDTMHAAFLGAAKLHMTILSTTTKASYYIGHLDVIKIIDKILLSIKPPSRRARTPRSIHFYAQWKASEWRNWLDYAPACLKPVLEEKYVNHLALLSEAMHYLNSDSITLSELDRASMLLKEYVRLFEKFFGTEK